MENLAASKTIVVDGRPWAIRSRSCRVTPGDYRVQAVFNVYEQFHLADGRNLWLPPDKGEGQHWNRKPGNPYNEVATLHVDPKSTTPIKLSLDKTIPPIEGTDADPAKSRPIRNLQVATVRPLQK